MELMWTHSQRWRREKGAEKEREKEEAAKRNVIVAVAAVEACSMYTETNGWSGKCCSD